MKKAVLLFLLLLLFAAVPSVFSQIASIHYAEAFPELCFWVNHIPFVRAENAESVKITEWQESPAEGRTEAGYTELIYEGNFLISKTGYGIDGEMEYSFRYVYDDGYLTEIEYDYPLYDSLSIYNYDHYEDRIEVHLTNEAGEKKTTEWIKTLWYDTDNYLTKIEGPDWNRVFYYDDGFLVRAEEERWGQIFTTAYTYNENALLESVSVDGEYDITVTYDSYSRISSVYLDAYYQTTVFGDLEVELDERGHISRLGPNEITWSYTEK